ncbi:MAG: DUF4360 domain-containing protein [Bdellovibrionales bacterium]|nr:DUF4360 domain-containing protein [Bdellovibrionales bacterium]
MKTSKTLTQVRITSMLMAIVGFTFLSAAQADIITFPTEGSEPEISVSQVAFAGAGCPQDSSRALIIGSKAVLLSHPGFAGSLSEGNLVRKNCSVRIPVAGVEGYQVALQAQNPGRIDLGEQDKLTVNRELFVAGSTGEVQSKVFTGKVTQRIQIASLAESKLRFSNCGESAILAMNFSALLRASGRALKDSSFGFDKTRLNLVVRKCK